MTEKGQGPGDTMAKRRTGDTITKRTGDTMAKRKTKTRRQTLIYKTLH